VLLLAAPVYSESPHAGLGKPVKACTEVPASQSEEKLEHSRCAELIFTMARLKVFQEEQPAETNERRRFEAVR
jgi:hypothetical protein